MSEAAVLLKRLSEHVEGEHRQEKEGEARLGQVTLLDMGSYLLSLIVKLIEVEAQERLKEVELRLQDDKTVSSAEKDRIFAEQAKKSADAVVVQLKSLPTNCVFEGTRKKLETMIGLSQRELQ